MKDCKIIAEVGANHQGDLEVCKQMFREAKSAGADFVKLQKRENKTLFTKTAYNKPYENENSYGATYGEHREALEFNREQYLELQDLAIELDIVFFATAFDIPSVDFLESIDMPMYKVASGDLKNTQLIDYIVATGKPVIISTGGAWFEDIDRVYLKHCDKDITLLHCIASYPNQLEDLNLNAIGKMKTRYPNAKVGFSSHHPSVYMNYMAYSLGAEVIEVHFTLNRANKGTDNAFSLEPKGLSTLCSDIKNIRKALGHGEKIPNEVEIGAINKLGKGIYPTRSIEKGEEIKEGDIKLCSPGGGLPPYKIDDMVGSIALSDLSTGVFIDEDDIDG